MQEVDVYINVYLLQETEAARTGYRKVLKEMKHYCVSNLKNPRVKMYCWREEWINRSSLDSDVPLGSHACLEAERCGGRGGAESGTSLGRKRLQKSATLQPFLPSLKLAQRDSHSFQFLI